MQAIPSDDDTYRTLRKAAQLRACSEQFFGFAAGDGRIDVPRHGSVDASGGGTYGVGAILAVAFNRDGQRTAVGAG
jgi:hypothetical protein